MDLFVKCATVVARVNIARLSLDAQRSSKNVGLYISIETMDPIYIYIYI